MAPNVFGQALRINPLLVIFALLLGGRAGRLRRRVHRAADRRDPARDGRLPAPPPALPALGPARRDADRRRRRTARSAARSVAARRRRSAPPAAPSSAIDDAAVSAAAIGPGITSRSGRWPSPPPACAACARPACCAASCARPSCRSSHLVYPMFVVAGGARRTPIAAMPGIDHLSIDGAVEEAGIAAALGIPAVLLFGLPADQGRAGLRRLGRRGRRSSSPRARSRPRTPTCWSSPTCACASTRATATAACCATTAWSTTTDARAARPHRGLAGRGRRRRRRAERHDGRARRRAARRARRARPVRDADHRLQRQVRLRLLRPVPRGRRLRARRWATAAATRWIPPTRARRVREAALDADEGADVVMVKPALPYLDVIRRVQGQRPSCRSPPTTSAASTR